MAMSKELKAVSDWLRRYEYLGKNLADIEEQIAVLTSRVARVTASYSLMPRGGSASRDDTLLQLTDMQIQLKDIKLRYHKARVDIENAIEKLPDSRLSWICRHRYLNGEAWQSIAHQMGYSLDWVYDLHQKALEYLKDNIDITRQ